MPNTKSVTLYDGRVALKVVRNSHFDIYLTISYFKKRSKCSKHRSMLAMVLGFLLGKPVEFFDTSNTLTGANELMPAISSTDYFDKLASALKEYVMLRLGLETTPKMQEHNAMFRMVVTPRDNPDVVVLSRDLVCWTSHRIDSFKALKRKGCKRDQLMILVKQKLGLSSKDQSK